MMDLVIQIVNYKTKKYLSKCIESAINGLEDSGISHEILILDNGSGDDLSDLEDKYKSEAVKFYYSGKNLGFGAGHNLLARKGESKYIFVLNPDCVVEKNSIKILFDFMEIHPEAGVCGPRIDLIGKNFFFHKKVFWPNKFIWKEFFDKFFNIKIFKNFNFIEYNPIVGSALFIRKKAFDEVGGFDENLFLYFEEGDLCNSLKNKNYKIYFVYNSVIKHFYGKSDVSKSFKIKHFIESRRYFYKKWYGDKKAEEMLKIEDTKDRNKILEKFL